MEETNKVVYIGDARTLTLTLEPGLKVTIKDNADELMKYFESVPDRELIDNMEFCHRLFSLMNKVFDKRKEETK